MWSKSELQTTSRPSKHECTTGWANMLFQQLAVKCGTVCCSVYLLHMQTASAQVNLCTATVGQHALSIGSGTVCFGIFLLHLPCPLPPGGQKAGCLECTELKCRQRS